MTGISKPTSESSAVLALLGQADICGSLAVIIRCIEYRHGDLKEKLCGA